MRKQNNSTAPVELKDDQLDHVTGGSAINFLKETRFGPVTKVTGLEYDGNGQNHNVLTHIG